MRYVGGKSKIAPAIAKIINSAGGGYVYKPFLRLLRGGVQG